MFLVPPDLARRKGPDWRTALRGLLFRAVVPGIALWLVISAFGQLLTGPLAGWDHSESALNRSLQGTRDQTWDTVTALWSHAGNTEIIIGVCAVAVGVLWWRTRRWWFAAIPAIAISLQASIFVAATLVTGRPRPDVPHLDPAPPTSSYPSGHVGATMALYASFVIMATGIRRTWLRRTVIGVCSVIPVLVAYARLYRGMHHLSDVLVGAVNGLLCAGLAAGCLLRRHRGKAASRRRPRRPATRSGRSPRRRPDGRPGAAPAQAQVPASRPRSRVRDQRARR
jgi:membrane-associated phospholipid phosphatase